MTATPKSQTVFVTAADDAAMALRETAASWAAAAIMVPSLWVSSSAVDVGIESLSIATTRCDATGQCDSDLLEELARRRLDLIRVVAVHMVGLEYDGTTIGDAASSVLTGLRGQVGDIEVVPITLLVPLSGVFRLDRRLVRQSWATVVVSAEDRALDRRTVARQVVAGDEGNQVGHSLLACSTVGGLLLGVEAGPFDEPRDVASGGVHHAVMARSFVRMLHGGSVLDRVCARVLLPRAEWPRPIEQLAGGQRMALALDPAQVVEQGATDLLQFDNSTLQYRPFEGEPAPVPRTVGVLQAIREFGTYLLTCLKRLPYQAATRIKTEATQRIESFVQDLTYGPNAGVVVRLGGHERPQVIAADSAVADATRVLELAKVSTTKLFPAEPNLWRAVRGLSLALIDGGDLPQGCTVPRVGDGPRCVLTRPDWITPDERSGLRLGVEFNALLQTAVDELAPKEVRPLDADLTRQLRDAIQRANDLVQGAHSETQAVGEASPSPPAPSTDQAEEAPGQVEEAPGQAEEATFDSEQVESMTAALDSWESERSRSLLWRVATGVTDAISAARKDVAEALRVLATGVESPDPQSLSRATRSLNFWTLGTAIGILGTLVILLLLLVLGPIGISLFATLLPLAILLGLGALFVRFYRYKSEEFRLLHRPRAAVSAFDHAGEVLIEASQELVRLGSLYSQLMTWGQIISRLVYHPWGDAKALAAGDTDPDVAQRPDALQVRAGVVEDAHLEHMYSVATQRVFRTGWLHECFGETAKSALERFRVAEALEYAPEPEMDRPQLPNGALACLVEALVDDRYSDESLEARRAIVIDACLESTPADLFVACRPLTNDESADEGESQSVSGFLSEVVPSQVERLQFVHKGWSSSGRVVGQNRVERVAIWAPATVEVPNANGIVRERASSEPGAQGLSYCVARVDVSPPAALEAFSIFGNEAPPVEKPERASDPDDDSPD